MSTTAESGSGYVATIESATWWKTWKERIGTDPLVGEVRIDFVRLIDVREKEQDFEARVRVTCKVDLSRFQAYIIEDERRAAANAPDQVKPWVPKMIFQNLKKQELFIKWVRRESETSFVFYYVVEIIGLFSVNVHFFNYPIDTQKLTVQVSTDWDEGRLVYVSSAVNHFEPSEQFEIKREYELCLGVETNLTGTSTSKYDYCTAEASVLIKRKAFSVFMLMVARPFITTSLGFAAFVIQPSIGGGSGQTQDEIDTQNADALNNRLQIVLILLLAMAVDVKKSGSIFNFLDIYILVAFLILVGICLETVLVLSQLVIDDALKRANDRIGGGILAGIWGAMNIVLILVSFWWFQRARSIVKKWMKKNPYNFTPRKYHSSFKNNNESQSSFLSSFFGARRPDDSNSMLRVRGADQ